MRGLRGVCFGLMLVVSWAGVGCSKVATVKKGDGTVVEGVIVGADETQVAMMDRPSRKVFLVPRAEIAEIEHPGQTTAALGGGMLVVGGLLLLADGGGGGGGHCCPGGGLVFGAAGLVGGSAMLISGLVHSSKSSRRARPENGLPKGVTVTPGGVSGVF